MGHCLHWTAVPLYLTKTLTVPDRVRCLPFTSVLDPSTLHGVYGCSKLSLEVVWFYHRKPSIQWGCGGGTLQLALPGGNSWLICAHNKHQFTKPGHALVHWTALKRATRSSGVSCSSGGRCLFACRSTCSYSFQTSSVQKPARSSVLTQWHVG